MLIVLAAVLATALVAALVALWTGGHGGRQGAATTSSGMPANTTTATPSPGVKTSWTTSTGQPTTSANASAELQRFFGAAQLMDEQLHEAAERINASGPPWDTIREDVARSVRAADVEAVTQTIPAGMPANLKLAVFVVYSELASRRAAMGSFAYAQASPPPPPTTTGHYDERDLVAELANGHQAAARFEADLEAAKALARQTPPLTIPASRSRDSAERLLLIQLVLKSEFGCNARGGFIMTRLPRIVWTDTERGYIDGVEFTAKLGADGIYTVDITAC